MRALERLKARLPGVEDAALEHLLTEAADVIRAYTRRTALPETLTSAQVELAVIAYNRQGIEGETAHSEGGVSRVLAPIPESVLAQLRPYRRALIG